MRDSRKLVMLLWSVIAVLVIGCGVGGYLLAHKVDQLSTDNTDLSDSNDSLRQALSSARAELSASPTPSPSATPKASASATPTPSASPSASATPTPSPAVKP